ncbi:MAG: hypothetical protein Q8L92_00940 [Rubrivivax sp.]|nr:hypothetical protein [Rubrivivax sp.]
MSVITQFDGPLIEFDDGLRTPSLSVIGGGIPSNGNIAIKIDGVHQDHDQQCRRRRQR